MVIQREVRIEDSQSQSQALVHVPDGLVHHALPITNDGSVFLRRLCPFCAETGEFELVIVLHVLCPKNYSKQLKLSV